MSTNLLATLIAKHYANASNARRAARANGVHFSGVVQDPLGWRIVVDHKVVEPNTFGDQLGGHTVPDSVLDHAPQQTPETTAPTYKEFARYNASSVDSPVKYVHNFVAANPNMSRKQAIFELVQRGVSYYTARTQFQVCHSRRNKANG